MKRDRGATLVEILISLAVVLVGMAGMFRVLASSVIGSSSASKLSQAQFRAETILESIRTAPQVGLTCLAGNPPSNWETCETSCRTAMGATPHASACIFTTGAAMKALTAPDTKSATPATHSDGLVRDRSTQAYVVMDASSVTIKGANLRVYDALVIVGWNDDGNATANAADHVVTLRSGVFK